MDCCGTLWILAGDLSSCYISSFWENIHYNYVYIYGQLILLFTHNCLKLHLCYVDLATIVFSDMSTRIRLMVSYSYLWILNHQSLYFRYHFPTLPNFIKIIPVATSCKRYYGSSLVPDGRFSISCSFTCLRFLESRNFMYFT